jgi:hypothetical protein
MRKEIRIKSSLGSCPQEIRLFLVVYHLRTYHYRPLIKSVHTCGNVRRYDK